MKLSTRSRYGTKMICHIAMSPETPVPLREIAEKHEISLKYLEQLAVPLKNAGLIRSVRGARGGYRLAKSPKEISIGDIVRLLEPENSLSRCIEAPQMCKNAPECVTRRIWARATRAMYSELEKITLEDALSEQSSM